jgi:hypothetical protein
MKCLVLTLFLLGLAAAAMPSEMKFIEDKTKGTLTIRDGQIDVLTYRFGDQLAEGLDPKHTRSCYIHPLFSLDGQSLTDDFPKDHLHHHGVFWTWPVVITRGQKTSSWETVSAPLRQHFVRWLKREQDSGAAVLSVENAWKLDGRETVARETVTLRVHPTEGVGRAIDLELEIEAVSGPLELRGTPDQNKGYGGLCFRGAPLFTGAIMTTDKGVLKEDVTNTPFHWADLSTSELGVAIFISPSHPDFPTGWLIRNSYAGVLNPSWPGLKPVVLQPGQFVRLRYRIFVHRGDAAAVGVRQAYERYIIQMTGSKLPEASER